MLVLNDVPIRAEEVDEACAPFALLEPQDTPLQLRKLALTGTVFPRVAAASIDPARREEARALAESYRRALESGAMPAGPLAGPMEVERTGTFREIGIVLWHAALDLEPGRWSAVLETPGSFHVLRVKDRKDSSLASLTRLTIGAFDFPFVQAETAKADLEAALDRAHLTILDPEWRDAVPAAWRYRLHVNDP